MSEPMSIAVTRNVTYTAVFPKGKYRLPVEEFVFAVDHHTRIPECVSIKDVKSEYVSKEGDGYVTELQDLATHMRISLTWEDSCE